MFFVGITLTTPGFPDAAGDGMTTCSDYAVLVHGLARKAGSMRVMEAALEQRGYTVVNVNYPSRSLQIGELARSFPGEAIRENCTDPDRKINFVTHSLGGILVRLYLENHPCPNLGRVVMLAPPNRGSELVDKLGGSALFGWIFGPAGRELGTGPESVPAGLAPISYEAGVIAGTMSLNPFTSMLLPGKDDGKVAVERTRAPGITDFVEVPCSHTFIMRDKQVIELTIRFLETGTFNPPDPAPSS